MTEPKEQALTKKKEAQQIMDAALDIAANKVAKACQMNLPEFKLLVGDKDYNEKTVETLAIILLTRAIVNFHE